MRDALLALLTNSWLHSWLPLTSLCQHLLCQLQVHLHLKRTKLGAENTCLTAQFGMFNCEAQHTGHAPQICFLSNPLLCQKAFTWKSVVHENIQISPLQGIYRLCRATHQRTWLQALTLQLLFPVFHCFLCPSKIYAISNFWVFTKEGLTCGLLFYRS